MNKDAIQAMLTQLKQPFDPRFVKWRVGATSADKKTGIALAYIDSREVMKRLDDVCGIDKWQDTLSEVSGGFISSISIKIGDEWVTRSNAAGNTKVEAIKGGASDAFKRAASKWGIGRYLYYLPNVWVPIKQQGTSYVLAGAPELPDWAIPNKNIERWEDVAELAIEASATGDVIEAGATLIEHLDQIRNVTTSADLDLVLGEMSEEDQLPLANEINLKRRELIHGSSVKTDNN